MLAIVPDIPETYENLKLIWELTEINKLTSYKFVADFKLLLTALGKQTATCRICLLNTNV